MRRLQKEQQEQLEKLQLEQQQLQMSMQDSANIYGGATYQQDHVDILPRVPEDESQMSASHSKKRLVAEKGVNNKRNTSTQGQVITLLYFFVQYEFILFNVECFSLPALFIVLGRLLVFSPNVQKELSIIRACVPSLQMLVMSSQY